MADLTTKYMGLTLKNPIIVGSSGLTDSIDNIKELENNGAAAVVLKSLFEEQIMLEAEESLKKAYSSNILYHDKSETLDYLDIHIKEETVSNYVELIKQAKKQCLIPIIASINCISSSEWFSFAKKIEEAGADALELNVALLPSDINITAAKKEQIFFEILDKVKKAVSIPVALKISPYFSDLARFMNELSQKGANGLVLFNRFYSPDFDINNFTEKSANTFSNPSDYHESLRWIAIMSGKINTSIAASTGNHDGKALIKQLLAGAKAVQVVSAIYRHGAAHIQTMLNELETWMEEKGFNYIEQFQGKMSQKESKNPAAFERIQFMKYFAEIH